MERMLRRLIGEDVELTTALEPELWRSKADPGQIEQVILNLVVNARDAMPRRRPAHGRDAPTSSSTRSSRASTRPSSPGPYVMLAVTDTGVGMDARAAGPHLRAVLHDQGARQGDRARPLDGVRHREAERRLDLGLQRARPRHDVQDLPAPLRGAARGPGRAGAAEGARAGDRDVLLVEDEPEVRRLVEKLLGLRGYTVLSAGSPADGDRPRPPPRGADRAAADRRHHARHERARARAHPGRRRARG